MPDTNLFTIAALGRALAERKTTSRGLVEQALARIADANGEGGRAFTKVHAHSALVAAEASDRLRKEGVVPSPLSGLPVSIKDLFDIEGDVTTAGSKVLRERPAASADAAAVARLRAAGAVVVGRSNMTEFAFSGIGINPHYGTPANPWNRAARRIPGGSSSGAAVSVSDGMAAFALGTDTGGSLRIPAALCGVTGFKPTSARVARDGAFPLSTTLDSVGPLANSIACCAITDAVMAGEPPAAPEPMPIEAMRLAVPQSYVLEGLGPDVADAFDAACRALSRAGARVTDIPLKELAEVATINAGGGFAPIEAYAWHQQLLKRRGADYDQRVRTRIERAAGMAAVDYIGLVAARADLIRRITAATADFDAMLMPAVAITAPPIAAFERDEDYRHLNALILRNTSVINFLDGGAATVPIAGSGAPVGLMTAGAHGRDHRVLAVARGIEAALAS